MYTHKCGASLGFRRIPGHSNPKVDTDRQVRNLGICGAKGKHHPSHPVKTELRI